MNIPSKPLLNFNVLRDNSALTIHSGLEYLKSGTDSILYALSILDRCGQSTVVLPGFICRSVPDAVRNAGYKVVYVDSQVESIWPSPESYRKVLKSKGTYIIFLVEFFGAEVPYFQELQEKCRGLTVNLLLIDAIHALLKRIMTNRSTLLEVIEKLFRYLRLEVWK